MQALGNHARSVPHSRRDIEVILTFLLSSFPVKTKHRTLNQENTSLHESQSNDAQHRKEDLKLMASVGLNYVSVVVYYDVVPPRFFVSCYLSEISAQIKQMEARLGWTKRTPRCALLQNIARIPRKISICCVRTRRS